MENPFIIYTRNEVSAAPLMAISQLMAAENTTSMKYKPIIWVGEHKEQLDPHATTPLLYPAGGLAWIAAPVPLMGVLGLLAMLFMMGRRGLLPALLYSVITFLALYCSVLPFVMTQSLSRIFQTGPLAVVRGPLPGFEQVLHFQEAMAGISVMAALVLSAGVPWLLTGLFLRGHEQEALPQDDDADLATG